MLHTNDIAEAKGYVDSQGAIDNVPGDLVIREVPGTVQDFHQILADGKCGCKWCAPDRARETDLQKEAHARVMAAAFAEAIPSTAPNFEPGKMTDEQALEAFHRIQAEAAAAAAAKKG
jgi:hypothetical protein